MRAAMHMALCLDEIRAELSGSSAVLSEAERVRLGELIDEASKLVSGVVCRQTVDLPSEATLHWIRIAIRAVQGDGEAPTDRRVATVASDAMDAAEQPAGPSSSTVVSTAGHNAPVRLVHSSPVAPSKQVARSTILRLVSRIAAAVAIAVSVGALLTFGSPVSPLSGQQAAQPREVDHAFVRPNAALRRFAVVATPD